MPDYYPIMLDVRGRAAIVLGGNQIAAEKAAALSACGAQVTVIHPQFCNELLVLEERAQVALCYKAYEPGDLAQAFVVVAVTNDAQLIDAIWQETQERNQLVNIVDVPAYCNFILPSILRREKLTIAVSTQGACPSLAKRIRQHLEALFPPTYGPYLRLASLARAHLRRAGVPYDQRDTFFGEYQSSTVLQSLEQGNTEAALSDTAALLRKYTIDIPASELEAEMQGSSVL